LKKKACVNTGIYNEQYILPYDTTFEELKGLIENLNSRADINGILVQHPLPSHINENKIFEIISPSKDVDGFNPLNIGSLCTGTEGFIPCTPLGIMVMLKESGVQIEGKHCVIIGRSNIVGKPLSLLMLKNNATVTICHTKTRELESICRTADILIAAAGRRGLVTCDMIKQGAVIIDVGTNKDEITGKSVGDIDFETVKEKAGFISPVPGGVGPMTIAMLLYNTILAALLEKGENYEL
jgi:methylenetetrahydrofolate dehydrogenase (NADP+)/methenyltetrahydrofolate cyclohydrolase